MTVEDAPLLIALAPLLAASGFFSGTETALFGLLESDKARLRAIGGIGARATETLLANPRPLLVSVLLANMTINVLVFVLLSVLTLHAQGAGEKALVSVGGLLTMILLGEVLPKIAATSKRVTWCRLFAPVMLTVHRVMGPLRRPLLALVIDPLARLVRPGAREDHLTIDELSALLTQSTLRGDMVEDEAALLNGVAAIGRFQARDVMTPRVDIRWLRPGDGADAARGFAEETGFASALVCEGTIDQGIVGVVDLARAVLDGATTVGGMMRAPVFVPESARLDQMLGTLRGEGERLAVVVDEFGGVAGVATLRDVARRILGSAPDEDHSPTPEVEELEPGLWRAPGRLSVRDWEDALMALPEGGPTTLGGVVVARLGRLAKVGDSVRVGNVTLRVESVHTGIVDSMIVSLIDDEAESSDDQGGAR